MPPRTGQRDYLEDLLDRHGLTAARMAELADEPGWVDLDLLPPLAASEAISWLEGFDPKDYD